MKLGGTAVAAGALGGSASADVSADGRASVEAVDTALAAQPIENVRIGYVGIAKCFCASCV